MTDRGRTSGKMRLPDAGEVAWIDFSPAVGHEQIGLRPAVVVSPLDYNETSSFVVVCPITSNTRALALEGGASARRRLLRLRSRRPGQIRGPTPQDPQNRRSRVRRGARGGSASDPDIAGSWLAEPQDPGVQAGAMISIGSSAKRPASLPIRRPERVRSGRISARGTSTKARLNSSLCGIARSGSEISSPP